MFDRDRWTEIFHSLKENKLRTILSGFTVALGLFIFIVLFGIGNGLQNKFTSAFIYSASNSMFIFPGVTSIPYKGNQQNKQVEFENSDLEFLKKEFGDRLEYSTGALYKNVIVKNKSEYGTYSIRAAHPERNIIELNTLQKGRWLNNNDIANKSKVAIIGRLVEQDLFKNSPALGAYLNINGINFRVVGIFSDEGGDREERVIYVPVSTQQLLDKGTDKLEEIILSYNKKLDANQAIALGKEITQKLKERKSVAPKDENAIYMRNSAEGTQETFLILFAILVVVMIIGFGTLMAGIIGISNIMVYIVKERTMEIGIRKALGAKPWGIVSLILQETLVVTLLFGAIGVALGLLTLNLIGNSLEDYFIQDPGVSTGWLIFAFFALVISGTIAGFVPALRASKIKPIEALRNE